MPEDILIRDEINTKIASLEQLTDEIKRYQDTSFDQLDPTLQAEILRLQGLINILFSEFETSGFKNEIASLRRYTPGVITNPEYKDALIAFFSKLKNQLIQAENDVQLQNTRSVPENLSELVRIYEESKQEPQEIQTWKEIIEEQYRRYNSQDIKDRIAMRLEKEEQLDNKLKDPRVHEYLSNTILTVTTDPTHRTQDLGQIYPIVLEKIHSDAGKLTVINSTIAADLTSILEPQTVTQTQRLLRETITSTIAEVQVAVGSRQPAEQAAQDLVLLDRFVVSPILSKAAKRDSADDKAVQAEIESMKSVATLTRQQREDITREINKFQQKVNQFTSALEGQNFIDEDARRAQLQSTQDMFFAQVRAKTGIKEKDLPAFIKGSIRNVSVKSPQEAQAELSQAKTSLEIAGKYQETPQKALSAVLAYDIRELRQAQPDAFLTHDHQALKAQFKARHPYLSDQDILKLLALSAALPTTMIGPNGEIILLASGIAGALRQPAASAQPPTSYRRAPEIHRVTREYDEFAPVFMGGGVPLEYGQMPSRFQPTASSAGTDPLSRALGLASNLIPGLGRSPVAGVAGTVARAAGISPVTWAIIGVVIFIVVTFFFINGIVLPGAVLPTNTGTTGGNGSSLTNIAYGSCPVKGTVGLFRTTYDRGGGKSGNGHGSDKYWSDLNETPFLYSIPDYQLYPGCKTPSDCPGIYGMAIDVHTNPISYAPAYAPEVCQNGKPCDSKNLTWTATNDTSNPGRPVVYITTTDALGNKWKIALIHVEWNGKTSIKTGESVGVMTTKEPPGNAHVHFEITLNGFPIDPYPFCFGGGGSGEIPGTLPPNMGQCTTERMTKYFPADQVTKAQCVCNNESGGNAGAQNRGCFNHATDEHSLGLFQINILALDNPIKGVACYANHYADAAHTSRPDGIGYDWPGVGSHTCTYINKQASDSCVNDLADPDFNAQLAAQMLARYGWRIPWRADISACGL